MKSFCLGILIFVFGFASLAAENQNAPSINFSDEPSQQGAHFIRLSQEEVSRTISEKVIQKNTIFLWLCKLLSDYFSFQRQNREDDDDSPFPRGAIALLDSRMFY